MTQNVWLVGSTRGNVMICFLLTVSLRQDGRTDRRLGTTFQILIRNFWCIKVLFSIKIFWNSCQMYAKLHWKCSLSYSLLEYGLLSLIFQDHGVTRGVSVRKSLLGKVVMRPGFSPPSHSPITTPLKPSSVTRNLIREALFIFWYFVRFEWFYVIVKEFYWLKSFKYFLCADFLSLR